MPVDDTPDLPSFLGLLIFLDVLSCGIIPKERVQYAMNLLHVRCKEMRKGSTDFEFLGCPATQVV